MKNLVCNWSLCTRVDAFSTICKDVQGFVKIAKRMQSEVSATSSSTTTGAGTLSFTTVDDARLEPSQQACDGWQPNLRSRDTRVTRGAVFAA